MFVCAGDSIYCVLVCQMFCCTLLYTIYYILGHCVLWHYVCMHIKVQIPLYRVSLGTEHVAGLVAVLLSLFHRVLQENADRVGIIKSSGAPQKVFRNSPEI